MNTRPTPETDAAERESIAAYIEAYGLDAIFPCDGYDLARKLERERDEARQTLCMIARLSVDLSDSPKSLQSHMTAWAKLYLEKPKDQERKASPVSDCSEFNQPTEP
jgi:hypothetical protein